VGVPHENSSRRVTVPSYVPVLPVFAGLAFSILRFRAGDSLGGLACALAGILLMLVLATRVPHGG
jgi:hypothetical protein